MFLDVTFTFKADDSEVPKQQGYSVVQTPTPTDTNPFLAFACSAEPYGIVFYVMTIALMGFGCTFIRD